MATGRPTKADFKAAGGNMKRAWEVFRRRTGGGGGGGGGSSRKRRRGGGGGGGGETIRSQDFGTDAGPRGGGGLRASIHGKYLWEYDKAEKGAVWEGLLQGLAQIAFASPTLELQQYFPALSTTGSPDLTDAELRIREKYSQETRFGTELASAGGWALIRFGITPQQWAQFYNAMLAATGAGQGPMIQGGGWTSPLAQPSEVTSPFGVARGSGPHDGVDLRAAVGTPVVAPTDLKVFAVGEDATNGKFIQAVARRPDGQFPEILFGSPGTPGVDDSTWTHGFAHLSQIGVQKGQEVAKGSQLGLSGNSGRSEGPHLHWKVKWFDDGILNQDIAVDPTAMVPLDVIRAGQGSGPPNVSGAANALARPLVNGVPDQLQSALPKQGQAIIISNSVVAMGTGTTTAVGTGGGNRADVDLGFLP